MPDGVLPFESNLGLPQKQRVKIADKAYQLYYSWNSLGEFVRLKIVRVEDGAVVFNSKLVELNPYEVRDPQNYELLFTLMPYSLSKENVEAWVFWDE